MTAIRLAITLILAAVGLVLLATPAAADNCDIYLQPEDCQNTAWTVGVVATVAGGAAVATVATATRSSTPNRSSESSLPPRARRRRATDQQEHEFDVDDVRIAPVFGPPSIVVQPINGVLRSHAIVIKVGVGPAWVSVEEVSRGPDRN